MKHKMEQALPPYSDYLVSAPRLNEKENRYYVILYPKNKESGLNPTSRSYARYLMSIELGEEVPSNMHVDHINGNCSDDRLENLQMLTCEENNRKRVRERGLGKKFKNLCCPVCKIEFKIELRNYKVHSRDPNRKFHCSRECSYIAKRK